LTNSLLHFDGTDNSTSIIDETNKLWTVSGTAKLSTARYKFAPSSLLLANGDYALGQTNYTYDLSHDFTIDLFIYPTANNGGRIIFWGGNLGDFMFGLDGGHLMIGRSGIVVDTTAPSGFANNDWSHIEVDRSGSTIYFFVNGVQINGVQTNSISYVSTGAPHIGNRGGEDGVTGNIDEFRISCGVARHTANFTPPTVPYIYTSTIVSTVSISQGFGVL